MRNAKKGCKEEEEEEEEEEGEEERKYDGEEDWKLGFQSLQYIGLILLNNIYI